MIFKCDLIFHNMFQPKQSRLMVNLFWMFAFLTLMGLKFWNGQTMYHYITEMKLWEKISFKIVLWFAVAGSCCYEQVVSLKQWMFCYRVSDFPSSKLHRPRVNFTNVLRAAFMYVSCACSIFVLTF